MDFDDTDTPKRTPDLRPYREQVAPDPVGRPPAPDSAGALVRFWAVNALRQRHRAQLLEQDSTPLGHARWLLATRQMLADFERLNLLRQLQLIAPEAAEACADDLITGGEHVGEPDHDRQFVERLYAMVDLFGIDRDRLTEEIAGETVEVESDPTWPVFTSREVWKATVRDRWLPWLEAQPIGTVVLANQGAYWTRTSDNFWASGMNVVSAIVLLKLHDDFVVVDGATAAAISAAEMSTTFARVSAAGPADAAVDRLAEDRADRRVGVFRRMSLIHDGATFLRRAGIDARLFGVFVHHIDAPDPGRDLHDHPWPFVSIILRGGYTEEVTQTRFAPALASIAERWTQARPGRRRHWRRWSVHRIRLTEAHRITGAEPGTVTLVLRGPKSQTWGFYQPDGFVDQRDYDYATRRPVHEVRS